MLTLFASMHGPGWTGGDAAWSARIPDGREVWLFGDTFLGGVERDGRRDPQTPMVRNSMVVEDPDGTARTLPTVVPSSGSDDWYWPGPPVVGRRALQVPMAHMVRTGPGGWDFAVAGTSLASFDLDDLHLRSLTPIATPPGVNMASAALTAGRFTYVYGTRGGIKKETFVARIPGRDLSRPWSYWTGSSWSRNPATAAAVASDVSDQFSVLRQGRRFVLVTQLPCTREVDELSATRPQGPWTSRGQIAEIPRIPHAITYNAIVHQEFGVRRGRATLGYSVNGQTEDAVYADAALYRPRFMQIRLRP